MTTQSITSWVTGHHIYKRQWTPEIGDLLECRREATNRYDRWAVAVYRCERIVGHVPRDLSRQFTAHLTAGRKISAQVIGKRENKRRRGLEVPVIYTIS